MYSYLCAMGEGDIHYSYFPNHTLDEYKRSVWITPKVCKDNIMSPSTVW